MSNLFQESTGTTPVTADGQPVGLVLDKSQGLELGPELVTNGTFDTDSDWTLGTGWTISGGVANANTTGNWVKITTQSMPPLVVGRSYLLKYTSVVSVGTLSYVLGGANNATGVNSSGDYEHIIVATSTEGLHFRGVYDFVGSIDNVSVKELKGNHASQPVATKRPTYNANPDRLTLDLVDDGLLVNIPVGGWDGVMVVGTAQGTASYGMSLPEGDYELGGDYFFGNTINQVFFKEGTLEPVILERIEEKFVLDGAKASYGDVTNFTTYWRGKNITEFPLIDTSSGTSFYAAWRDNNLASFPLIDTSSGTNFTFAWTNNNLTDFPLINTSSGVDFSYAWYVNDLTSFPLIDTSSGTNFRFAWYDNNLTSFPLLNTSSGTNFESAWQNNSLTSFPLIDTSNGINFYATWQNNSLTSFPLIDTSSGTSFGSAWRGNNLTSFPLIDTSSGTNFSYAWNVNVALEDFPANMFDNCLCTNFTGAFYSTALTQTSIDNILVSINSNGTSNGTFDQSGGSAPSATGQTAIDAMRSRGWTITVTGDY